MVVGKDRLSRFAKRARVESRARGIEPSAAGDAGGGWALAVWQERWQRSGAVVAKLFSILDFRFWILDCLGRAGEVCTVFCVPCGLQAVSRSGWWINGLLD